MIGAVTGTLDTRAFPPVKGMPSAMVEAGSGGEEIASARKGRRNWAKNRNKVGGRLIAGLTLCSPSRSEIWTFNPRHMYRSLIAVADWRSLTCRAKRIRRPLLHHERTETD